MAKGLILKRIFIIGAGTFLGILAIIVVAVLMGRSNGGWTRVDTKDPMTDAVSHQATTTAEDGGELSLNCTPGERPALFIQAPKRLGGFNDTDNFQKRMVKYRFDGGPVMDEVGVFADDMIGFLGKDTLIIEGMKTAEVMAVDVTSYNDERIVMTFDVTGADDVIAGLVNDCT